MKRACACSGSPCERSGWWRSTRRRCAFLTWASSAVLSTPSTLQGSDREAATCGRAASLGLLAAGPQVRSARSLRRGREHAGCRAHAPVRRAACTAWTWGQGRGKPGSRAGPCPASLSRRTRACWRFRAASEAASRALKPQMNVFGMVWPAAGCRLEEGRAGASLAMPLSFERASNRRCDAPQMTGDASGCTSPLYTRLQDPQVSEAGARESVRGKRPCAEDSLVRLCSGLIEARQHSTSHAASVSLASPTAAWPTACSSGPSRRPT